MVRRRALLTLGPDLLVCDELLRRQRELLRRRPHPLRDLLDALAAVLRDVREQVLRQLFELFRIALLSLAVATRLRCRSTGSCRNTPRGNSVSKRLRNGLNRGLANEAVELGYEFFDAITNLLMDGEGIGDVS